MIGLRTLAIIAIKMTLTIGDAVGSEDAVDWKREENGRKEEGKSITRPSEPLCAHTIKTCLRDDGDGLHLFRGLDNLESICVDIEGRSHRFEVGIFPKDGQSSKAAKLILTDDDGADFATVKPDEKIEDVKDLKSVMFSGERTATVLMKCSLKKEDAYKP